MLRRHLTAILACVVALAACSAQTRAPGSPGVSSRLPPATGLPTGMPVVSPGGALPFPTARAQRLEHARYAAAPPFDLAVTFSTPGPDWETLHLLGEFTDLVRWDGASRNGPPLRWIAFAHPSRIRAAADQPAAGRTPDEIAALLAERRDLDATSVQPFSVAGLDGTRLDLHANRADTIIFGGPGGDFLMEPSRSGRVGIVVAGGEPLLILVLAPRDELEEAWMEAGPLLASIELER